MSTIFKKRETAESSSFLFLVLEQWPGRAGSHPGTMGHHVAGTGDRAVTGTGGSPKVELAAGVACAVPVETTGSATKSTVSDVPDAGPGHD